MANRFIVSGAQLGILKALIESGECGKACEFIDEEIIDLQCVGKSSEPLEVDIEKCFETLSGPLPDSFRHEETK